MEIKEYDLFRYTNNFKKIEDIDSQLVFGETSNSIPYISIVIPTFNREELRDAIVSSINQKEVDFEYEIIVIDNNPETSVADKIIQEFNNPNILFYKNKANLGMAGNWNRGVELSRSNWICFLHDDDMLNNTYLYDVFKILNRRTDIDGLCSNTIHFGKESNSGLSPKRKMKAKLKKILYEKSKTKLMKINIVDTVLMNSNPYGEPSCGLLLKKDKIIQQGGFNEDYFPYLDWFFLFKYNKSNKIYKPFFVTGYYRWEINMSLKVDTLLSFVNDAEIIRRFSSKISLLGKFLYTFLRYEQHLNMVYIVISLNESINMEGMSNIYKYRGKTFKYYIYSLIKLIYWRLKIIMSILR